MMGTITVPPDQMGSTNLNQILTSVLNSISGQTIPFQIGIQNNNNNNNNNLEQYNFFN